MMLDLALLCITGLTAVYCFMLNRRLKKLHDLKGGMGKAVVSLTQSVSAMRGEVGRLCEAAQEAAVRLEAQLGRVDAYERKVDEILGTMDRQARETWKENKQRAKDTQAALDGTLADGRALAALLHDQIEALTSAVEAAGNKGAPSRAAAAQSTEEQATKEQAPVRRTRPAPRTEAAIVEGPGWERGHGLSPNPFAARRAENG